MDAMKNNKIKIIYMILLLVFATEGFGQTYSFQFSYNPPPEYFCQEGVYEWSIYGDNNRIDSRNFRYYSGSSNLVETVWEFPSVPNYNEFYFWAVSSCDDNGVNGPLFCSEAYGPLISSLDLIKTGSLEIIRCSNEVFTVNNFKPNVTIQNLNTTNPSEICSGFQLNLAAFPAGFPNEAYHWQYSLDNQATWVDLPTSFNDRQNNLFTMEEILGSTHKDYLNKIIYFRLGYSSNRPFTAPLAITYSPCAPMVTGINYIGPKCAGDPIEKVEVTFDRPLAADEVLNPISIQRTSNGPVTNQKYNVTFDADNPLKYTYTNIDPLENGKTYSIVYQAKKGSAPTGTSTTSTQTFTYIEPTSLKYAISNSTQPSCFGGNDGSIEIQVLSGTAPYHFYQDDIEVTPTIENGKYYLRGLSAKSGGYNIKVTDANSCIEK